MSFQTEEIKVEQPISAELYAITCGPAVYRLTSFAADVVHEGHVYAATQITRSAVTRSISVQKIQSVSIQIPCNILPFDNELYGHSDIFTVTITRKQLISEFLRIIYSGEIQNYSAQSGIMTLECFDKKARLADNVGRVCYTSYCNNSLYDSICQVSKTQFTLTISCDKMVVKSSVQYGDSIRTGKRASLSVQWGNPSWTYYSINPTFSPACTLKYSDLTRLPFNGLLMSELGTEPVNGIFTHIKTGKRYAIVDHDPATKTVSVFPFVDSFASGDMFDVNVGCDKSAATCVSQFNNFDRFVGFTSIPSDDVSKAIG